MFGACGSLGPRSEYEVEIAELGDLNVPVKVEAVPVQAVPVAVPRQRRPQAVNVGDVFVDSADEAVDRFIVRDADSRLNPRERLAVEEWIASGKRIHSIRDHPNHDRPLNGGMWGGVNEGLRLATRLVECVTKSYTGTSTDCRSINPSSLLHSFGSVRGLIIESGNPA